MQRVDVVFGLTEKLRPVGLQMLKKARRRAEVVPLPEAAVVDDMNQSQRQVPALSFGARPGQGMQRRRRSVDTDEYVRVWRRGGHSSSDVR